MLRSWLITGIAALSLVALAACLLYVRENQRGLVRRMSVEQQQVAEELAGEVEDRLARLQTDVRLLSALAERGAGEGDAHFRDEFEAITTAAGRFAAATAALHGEDGRLTLRATSVARELAPATGVALARLCEAGGLAARADAGPWVSPPLVAGGHTYRALAGATDEAAVAVAVDERDLLVDAGAWARRTAPAVFFLRELNLPASDALAPLLDRRSARGRRSDVLDAAEAASLGLPSLEAVVSRATVGLPGLAERRWELALVASTSALAAERRFLTVRAAAVTAVVLAVVLLLGGFALRQEQRRADLDERLRSAEQIAHHAERAEKIVDRIPVAVLALRRDGSVSAVNRHAVALGLGDAIGAPLRQAFPAALPALVDEIDRAATAARAAGGPAGARVERFVLVENQPLVTADEGHYQLHVLPLERPLTDCDVIVMIEDLSSLRRLQGQLIRAEKLATVGVLSAGIAHEIGTPLGVIRALAEQESKRAAADEKRRAPLQSIVEEIDRVSRIIRRLLDFSRKKSVADPEALDLAPLCHALVELLGPVAERSRARVAIDVPSELPRLMADSDQLQQVLMNLLVNACDACAGRRPAGHVTLRARADGEAVDIQIVDDGCGIPDANLHRVFDPFFTTKKRGEGTGLGLSVAADIVKAHGGRIDVQSQPGAGTTVTLRWPAWREGDAAAPRRRVG